MNFLKSNKKIVWTLLLIVAGALAIWYFNRSELEKNGLEENLLISGQIQGAGGLQLFLEAPSDRGVISVAQTELTQMVPLNYRPTFLDLACTTCAFLISRAAHFGCPCNPTTN